MKRKRDTKGRFTRTYREASRWEKIFVLSMLAGVLVAISLDALFVYAMETKEPVLIEEEVEQPKEVRLVVNIEWTEERIEKEIKNTFPEAPDLAVAIAKAESGLYDRALNPEAHRGCYGSYGIFQIACVHTDDTEALYDIETNIKKARQIYEEKGWQPWGAYTDGNYKKHL